MTGPSSPEQIKELMAGYALDDLDAEEIEQLERLIAENPQLATEVNRLQATWELLPYALPAVEPPSHLRSAILEAASPQTERDRTKNRSRLPWKLIVVSIAALLALALGIDNYRLRQALQSTRIETRPSDTLTYFLQATKSTLEASASVMVNPNDLKARLTAKNLPPLPPGKVYVLWTVLAPEAPFTKDSKGAILTDVFDVDTRGKVSRTIRVPEVYRSQSLIDKIAVTIENASSPQKHEGTPILIAKL